MIMNALTPENNLYKNSLNTKPITAPTRAPPIKTSKKSNTAPPASAQVNAAPLRANKRIILNTTIAVASFNKDSPSTRIVSLSGAPSSLNSEITATGSVAEIRAPNKSASVNGTSRKNHRPTAMKAVEISSAGIARIKTGIRSLTNCLAFRLNADSNNRAGRNRNRTMSGVS